MTTTAAGILQAGIGHMQDRASAYDKPAGERSMGRTVAAFNAITGHGLTEEQGWLLMGLLKMVRSQQGKFKPDNYEDEAAYAALRGECASRERAPDLILPQAVDDVFADAVALGVGVMRVTPGEFFDEERADIIGTNGNDGLHYEPERPRHLCMACGLGHSIHHCTAGDMPPVGAE